MDIELILKVAGVGMLVAVVCQILKGVGREEQSTLVSISGVVIILLLLADKIGVLIETIRGVFGL